MMDPEAMKSWMDRVEAAITQQRKDAAETAGQMEQMLAMFAQINERNLANDAKDDVIAGEEMADRKLATSALLSIAESLKTLARTATEGRAIVERFT